MFQSTPLKPLSLAHLAIETERQHCKEAYDQVKAAQLAEWVIDLCFNSAALSNVFIKFLDGEDMVNLPSLHQVRAKWRFIVTGETVLEGIHKDMKAEGKHMPRIGAASISLRLRARGLEDWLEQSPENLQHLSNHCSSARGMAGILCDLHLDFHPAVLAAQAEADNQPLSVLFSAHRNHPLFEACV